MPALQVLKLDAQMLDLAEELKTEQSLLVFGRGYNYATALEAALKVRIDLCVPVFLEHDIWHLLSVCMALQTVMCPNTAQHDVLYRQPCTLLCPRTAL